VRLLHSYGRARDTHYCYARVSAVGAEFEAATLLGRLVAAQVSLILRRAVDLDRPFSDHGLDSLGNLELRTRIETETGLRVSPKAIAAHNTARALATHLSDALAAEQTV